MKITDALLGEHGVLYALFGHLQENVRRADSLREVQLQAAFLASALKPHAELEDELLFSTLEPVLGKMGPLAVMRQEHEEIESTLEGLRELTDPDEAASRLLHVVQVAREHFSKEEQVLFPMAQQTLGTDGLNQLGLQWAKRREVNVGG